MSDESMDKFFEDVKEFKDRVYEVSAKLLNMRHRLDRIEPEAFYAMRKKQVAEDWLKDIEESAKYLEFDVEDATDEQ